MRKLPLERLEHYDSSIFRLPKYPVILDSVCSQWFAADWTPARLVDRYASIDVTIVKNLPITDVPYLVEEQDHHIHKTSFGRLLEYFSQNKACYVAQSDMSIFDGLEKDLSFDSLFLGAVDVKNLTKNLWIGNNTRSGLHFDYADNVLIQIFGTKEVYLAAPNQAKYLYALPENFTKTQVSPILPDYTRFNKLKNATFYVGVLNPGDVLLIPKGWFHYIYSPKQSISVNCWFGDNLTFYQMCLAFFRSGRKSWLEFVYGFFKYGLMQHKFKGRVFSSFHMGKLAYENLFESKKGG